jgi:hypothetical protein
VITLTKGFSNQISPVPLAIANGIDIYLIMDRDADWKDTLDLLRQKGYIKDNMFHVWKRDFEYDNFDAEQVVNSVNAILKNKKQMEINPDKVHQKLSRSPVGLMAKT